MNSVVVISIDRPAVERALADYVGALRAAHPEIERVIWYGSWVTGHPTPRSDVDLCLILSHSDLPRRGRAAGYLPVGFPAGLDLVVLTRAEFERLPEVSPGLHAAIAAGRDL